MPSQRDLLNQIKAMAESTARARDEVEAWSQRYSLELDRMFQNRMDAAQQAHVSGARAASEALMQTLQRARAELLRVQEGAGVWAAPWFDGRWAQYQPPAGPPPVLRLGEATIQDINTPFLVPFAGGQNLLVHTGASSRQAVGGSVRSWLLRLLATIPPGRLRLLLVDPVGLGEQLAGFMHLADYVPELVTGKVWSERADIEKQMANLSAHMETVIQTYLRGHFRSMEEYNAEAGEVAEPYHVLAVLNFPHGFSEDGFRRLVSIAQNGPRCGVYTFVTVDRDAPMPRWCNLATLESSSLVLTASGSGYTCSSYRVEGLSIHLDIPPSATQFEQIVKAVGAAAKAAATVEFPFEKIAPQPSVWWKGDVSRSLSTPIGGAGARRSQIFELGVGTAQHALVAGRTGSGKSTLLHVIITGLALTYSPDDLELYLIDFKKGVEFKDYARLELPHARVVAIEGEREFGISVLQGLDEELQRRGDLFRRTGVNSLGEYRVLPETARGRNLPRVLLLVDEFQEFFVADDSIARQAALLLDRLARQGRAFGMHVLLGSQTLSGAWTLARSTMDQMAVRIALQCSEADSRLVLSDENPAARLLTRPGEGFYNAQNGLKEGNNRFQVAWLSEIRRRSFLEQIQERAKREVPGRRPIVFEGDAPARLDAREDHPLFQALAQPERIPPRTLPLYLGDPVAIKPPTAAVLSRRRDRNLLIAGRSEDLAAGMFAAALISLAVHLPPEGLTLHVADLTVATAEGPAYLEELAAALPEHLRPLPPRRLAGTVAELAAEVRRRATLDRPDGPTICLAIFGLHRARDLRMGEGGLLRRSAEPASPAEQFALILKEGPEVGIHVIVWADSAVSVTQVVDRRTLGEFGLRAVLPMSDRESQELLGSSAASRLAPFRALLFDEEQAGSLEKFRPYERPSSSRLNWLGARLGAP